jgi:hypothetical protein
MSEKQDPENREETLTSNRPASTSRRNTQEESRDVPGAYNSFRGQAAENPRLSSYMFPRAGEPWRHHGPASPPRFSASPFSRKFSDLELFTELPPAVRTIGNRGHTACHSYVRAKLPGTATCFMLQLDLRLT